jgi:uncharacterized protein YndB with AHSA1/START domain
MSQTDIAVRREILVDAPPDRAFAVFTDGIDGWWPRDYSVGAQELDRIVVEPARWLEVGRDGAECVWGDVLAFEPPRQIVLGWAIGGDWQLEPAQSEIEVTFAPAGAGTRVTLEHRRLERHTAAEALREAVDGDGGWDALLRAYSAAV